MHRRTLLTLPAAILSASQEKEVLAALDLWRKATLARDAKTLQSLMHPDLWFSHSDARLETRDEFITALTSGQLRYDRLDLGPQKVSGAGSTAWTRGDMSTTVVRPTGTNQYQLNVLHVWSFSDNRWQMVARQSTRRPTP